MPDVTFKISDGYPSITGTRDLRFRPREVFQNPADDSIVYPKIHNKKCAHDELVTLDLAEGPWSVAGLAGAKSVDFDVPAEGGELWGLIAANLAIPPQTSAQRLAQVVADYVDEQGITPTTNETVAGFVTSGATKAVLDGAYAPVAGVGVHAAIKSNTPPGGTVYYALATLPPDNGANSASVEITGRIGGWLGAESATWNIYLSNRTAGYTGDAITGVVTAQGQATVAAQFCRVAVYTLPDKSAAVWLQVPANRYFLLDVQIKAVQASTAFTGTPATPAGTLRWSSQTAPRTVFGNNGLAGYLPGIVVDRDGTETPTTFKVVRDRRGDIDDLILED
jgi:hypothetical protein